MAASLDDVPIHAFPTAKAFEAFLAKNHDKVPAIRIRFAKKGSGITSITYKEALDVALCWGWIDGRVKSESETTYLHWFGRRKAKSLWSKINQGHVDRLVAEGRMRPPGMAEVERAKGDGRWAAAYHAPSAATVPPDLEAALAKNKKANAFFAKLDSRNRYAILHRLATAKKPETRQRRLTTFVEMLGKGEKIYP